MPPERIVNEEATHEDSPQRAKQNVEVSGSRLLSFMSENRLKSIIFFLGLITTVMGGLWTGAAWIWHSGLQQAAVAEISRQILPKTGGDETINNKFAEIQVSLSKLRERDAQLTKLITSVAQIRTNLDVDVDSTHYFAKQYSVSQSIDPKRPGYVSIGLAPDNLDQFFYAKAKHSIRLSIWSSGVPLDFKVSLDGGIPVSDVRTIDRQKTAWTDVDITKLIGDTGQSSNNTGSFTVYRGIPPDVHYIKIVPDPTNIIVGTKYEVHALLIVNRGSDE